MGEATGRPQDQGRSHRRRAQPSAETSTLLEAYRGAMRSELRTLLASIAGTPPAPGLLDPPGQPRPAVQPPIAERTKLWDLAIKLGRELGDEVDPSGPAAGPAVPSTDPTVAAPARRGRPDFG